MQPTDEQELIRLTNAYRKAEGALAVARKELSAKQAELCPIAVGSRVKCNWRHGVFEVTVLSFSPGDDPATEGHVSGRAVRKDGTLARRGNVWLGRVSDVEVHNGSL